MKFPKLGDQLNLIMTGSTEPEPCIVTYVNKPHNYYQVRFINSGVRECYKVQNANEIDEFKKDYRRTFGKDPKGIYIYESGVLCDSIAECAKEIGVRAYTIVRHLNGYISNVNGHHIYLL